MSSPNVTKAEHQDSQLLQRREIILAAIHAHLHSSDDPGKLSLVNHLEEVGDWAEADLQNDTDIALLGKELAELREIDAALLRIKAGTYGICAECGETISEKRMIVQPTALRCLACQVEADKRHGLGHNASL